MTKNILVAGLLAIGILPFAARADLITGELNFTGTVILSLDHVQFGNNIVTAGSFNIDPAGMQQGGFVALGGTTGSIENILNPPYAPGVIFPTPSFMTFAAAPNISVQLDEVLHGTDGAADCAITTAASGQTCTPALLDESMFNLQNTSATSSTASFGILGFEVDSLTDTTSFITGTFTIPLATANFQQLEAVVAGGGAIEAPFSGQFTVGTPAAVTPEPAPLIEVLIGGMSGLGLYVRRAGKYTKS